MWKDALQTQGLPVNLCLLKLEKIYYYCLHLKKSNKVKDGGSEA